MDLKSKHAIVTGVSKGIGKAIAEQLLEKDVRVAGWSRKGPDIQHKNFQFFPTDVTDRLQVENSYKESMMFLEDRIDILVNNAGLGIFKVMEELSPEDWQVMFATNVHSIFYISRLVIPEMKSRRSGHIINISSTAGLDGIPEATAYCGTKHAVRGISASMFKELRKDNIKVSCVYPGSVNTDFFENYPGITANETMLSSREVGKTIVHLIETPDNFVTMNVEIRPINPKYKI